MKTNYQRTLGPILHKIFKYVILLLKPFSVTCHSLVIPCGSSSLFCFPVLNNFHKILYSFVELTPLKLLSAFGSRLDTLALAICLSCYNHIPGLDIFLPLALLMESTNEPELTRTSSFSINFLLLVSCQGLIISTHLLLSLLCALLSSSTPRL